MSSTSLGSIPRPAKAARVAAILLKINGAQRFPAGAAAPPQPLPGSARLRDLAGLKRLEGPSVTG